MKIKKNIFYICNFVILITINCWGFSKKPDAQLLESNIQEIGTSVLKTGTKDKKNDFDLGNTSFDKLYHDFLKSNTTLVDAFSEYQKNNTELAKALDLLKQWTPENTLLDPYKSYFLIKWNKQDQVSSYTNLFKKLKSERRYQRLRIAILIDLLKMDIIEKTNATDFLIKESRLVIKQIRGSSEGEALESMYLKWLLKNNNYRELCTTEKKRWYVETTINFSQMNQATQSCPIDFESFQSRLRRLLFAAKEKQAQEEVEQYANVFQIEKWKKIYLQALYDSNTGDPALAFKNLKNHEVQILNTDYAENYFYIAQRAGELQEADRIIKLILKGQLSPQQYKEMKFQQGFLFYQTKQYKLAHEIFDQLYKSNRNFKNSRKKRVSKELDQIAWLRAWTLYLDNQFDKALKAFVETKPFASDQARLAYWIADVKLKLDQEGEAIAEFRRLADPILEQKAFSFYNFLAWLRLDKLKQEYKPSEIFKNLAVLAKMNKGPFPAPSDDLTYSQVVKSYSMFDEETLQTDEGDIQVANSENILIENSDTVGVDIDSQKDLQIHSSWAKFLIQHNEPDLAKWHLYEIEKKINSKKKAEYLAQFYLEHQFYYRALSVMNRFAVMNKAQLSMKSEPLLWGALFPEAYRETVFKHAEKRRIDPYLVLSIMRAETQYKADAISPVGAVGLMQFMPYSAKKVSMLLDQPDIQTESLFAPDLSISYGATYLKKLSVEMDSQKPLVAAAYNGGPHRVKAWLKNIGSIDYDKFIEHIPFAETRTYVKRVITFRATYDKLYSKSLETEKYKYLLQPVPVKVEGQLSLKEEWDQFKSKIN